jgi:hypothetical protein
MMAQKNDLAEKKRVLVDGQEVEGLVNVAEVSFEKGTIEVPEFKRIRNIQNGVTKVPKLVLIYKIKKGAAALTFFKNWYFDDEVHDVTVIRTDATGTEFARNLHQSCECVKFAEPEYDAASPTYAKVTVDLLPYEITPLTAQ